MNRGSISVFAGFAALVLSAPAGASSSRVPFSYVDRPLTLPDQVLRLDGGPRWPDYDAQFKYISYPGPGNEVFLNPGLSLGFTQDLEGGLVVPVRLAPDERLEDPRIYVLYRVQESEVSWGIFGQVKAGVRGQTELTAGVPLFYRASNTFRIETGGFLEVGLGAGSQLNLIFPVYFPFQVSERLYIGPEAGLGLYGVFEDGGGFATPVGGFLGYTLGSGRPLGDLYTRLRLTDVPNGAVELMVGVEFYFDI